MDLQSYLEYKDSGVEWLGRIPTDWDVLRIKMSVESARNGIWGQEPDVNDSPVWCVRVADFDRKSQTVDTAERTMRTVTPDELIPRRLLRGDLLLEKSGGGENNPVGFVVRYDHDDIAVCSNFVAKVRLRPGMDPRFWTYVHATTYSVRLTQRSIKQTSGIQNLDQASYFNELAPFPPFEAQKLIADFLDRETSQIDELIGKQDRLIELLTEKRQAIIADAVTNGLNPAAPTRPSGIHDLGEIPSHWTVPQLGMHAKVGNGSTPNRDTAAYWSGGIIPWLNSGHVNRAEVTDTDQFVSKVATAECHLPIVAAESLLVGLTGQGRTRGMTSILRFSATINQHVAYVTPEPSVWDPEYLLWFLRFSYGRLRDLSDENGSTKGALTCAALKKFRVPLPPLDEQLSISARIAVRLRRLDRIMAVSTGTIALLKERRAALISAAVTGKIDVHSERELS